MTDDDELVDAVRDLLTPGELALAGVIVRTAYDRHQEIELHEATVDVGDAIAAAAGVDDWYVYSGNDDSNFASNQHQGLRVADDAFVWECQHLLRGETFELVYYYEADVDQAGIVRVVEDLGFDAIAVESPDR